MSLKPAAFLAIAVLLAPCAALAAHGKVGLWTSTTNVVMPNVPNMPAQSHTATFCMTAVEVNSDAPPVDNSSGCTYRNISVQGHTYTADMVCTGQFKGTGHFSSTYDSDTHYKSTVTIVGEGFNMTNQVEGHWLKADCAGANH